MKAEQLRDLVADRLDKHWSDWAAADRKSVV